MLKLFFICIGLKLLDIGTTAYLFSTGVGYELNPLMRWVFNHWGLSNGLKRCL